MAQARHVGARPLRRLMVSYECRNCRYEQNPMTPPGHGRCALHRLLVPDWQNRGGVGLHSRLATVRRRARRHFPFQRLDFMLQACALPRSTRRCRERAALNGKGRPFAPAQIARMLKS